MITLYNENDAGVSLNTAFLEALELTVNDLRGFFLKSQLLDLLDQNDCVGIRIYNIIPTNGNAKLIAVGAKEDGHELKDKYLVSQDAISIMNNLPANLISNRPTARAISNATPSETQFMSFFSKDMMNNMLSNTMLDDAIGGIAFCQASLEFISDKDLTDNAVPHLVTIKSDTSSHVAVPLNLVNNSISMSIFNQSTDGVMSIKPCPGHCLKKEAGRAATRGRFPAAGSNDAAAIESDPYLFKWHDYDKDND